MGHLEFSISQVQLIDDPFLLRTLNIASAGARAARRAQPWVAGQDGARAATHRRHRVRRSRTAATTSEAAATEAAAAKAAAAESTEAVHGSDRGLKRREREHRPNGLAEILAPLRVRAEWLVLEVGDGDDAPAERAQHAALERGRAVEAPLAAFAVLEVRGAVDLDRETEGRDGNVDGGFEAFDDKLFAQLATRGPGRRRLALVAQRDDVATHLPLEIRDLHVSHDAFHRLGARFRERLRQL
mmetsp:Transcript_52314/g.154409  ORF Transcript_52314/g.154409 Transcript_52314/m.154409 type:complete len:242 (-) Transcript_52314:300-1025(-)